jgi:hypothetical protein
MPTVTKKYLHNIDLAQNQLISAVLENRITVPTSPVDGQLYYNTLDKKIYCYSGSTATWQTIVLANTSNAISVGSVSTTTASFGQYIDFTPIAETSEPAYQEGRMYYNSDEKTLILYGASPDVEIAMGEREWVRCRNNTGATIPKGSPVYVTGVHIPGNPVHGHHPTIALADGSDFNKRDIIGVTGQDILNGDHGYVVARGYIEGLNTSALTTGKRVYLDWQTPGGLTSIAPEFPNYSYVVGICLTSDASVGTLYVFMSDESLERLRVINSAYIEGDLTVAGNFNVIGNSGYISISNLNVANNWVYLGSGDSVTATFSGTGLNDMTFKGNYEGSVNRTFYVKIDGTGTPNTFAWSYDNFATTQASGIAITGNLQSLAYGISVQFQATTGHTLNAKWTGPAATKNVDFGVYGSYVTTSYTHAGFFRDATDGEFKFFSSYVPEITGIIDTANASFALGTVTAASFRGALIGNADTVTNGVYTNSSYANPSWITSLAWTKITGAPAFITSNQNITLSGAVSGSGTTAITTTLGTGVVGITNISATGTASSTTFLRGDGAWATPAGGGGTTTNALTINNGGSGAASGTTFNGSAAVTISYNTVGAQAALNGTGFVKASGTTISYDNSTYLTSAGAVTSINFGTTGLTPSTATTGAVTVAGTLNVANGGTGFGSVSTAPAATAWAGWDANKNLTANNSIRQYTTIATAAGTTTLTVGSTFYQYFTGTSTQTVVLPVATTLVNGQSFKIVNTSTNTVTVQTSGTNVVQAMATNTQLIITCINTAGGTNTASWDWYYGPIKSNALPVALGGTGATTLTGLVKGNGTGAFTAAAAGTDYQAVINGTGFVKASGTTISYDNSTYLTANQSITLSGDVSGTGTTAITTTLATVTQSTGSSFVKITLDTKGRVTGNTAVAASDLTTLIGATTYAAYNANGYLPLNGGTLSGSLTATSFVKSGGTSSQILAADGTVITAGTGVTISGGTINASGTGGGTVTSVSVVSANGFAGTVATASATPAITLTTTITGLLKGNGTAISAATAGTDYQAALTGTGFVKSTAGTISYDTNTYLTANQSITFTPSGDISSTGGSGATSLTPAVTVTGLRGVALPALGATAGLLKYTGTGTNTWVFDSSAYLTANQSITLSGDISGTGTTAITTTLATVTQSTGSNFVKITLDTKGRVTGNTTVAASDLNSTYGSQTANTFYGAPNGTAGNPSFRALVAADIPALNYLATASPVYTGTLISGTLTFVPGNALISLQSSANTFNQILIQNTSTGTSASSDIVVNNNLSTETTYYGDFGINSSNFSGTGSLGLANATYLYSSDGDLSIGTVTANAIHFVINGSATDAATIKTTGQFQLPGYTSTSSYSGTATGYLAFDSSGNVITVTAPTGGSGGGITKRDSYLVNMFFN